VGHVTDMLGIRPYNFNCHPLNPSVAAEGRIYCHFKCPFLDLGGAALSLSSMNFTRIFNMTCAACLANRGYSVPDSCQNRWN